MENQDEAQDTENAGATKQLQPKGRALAGFTALLALGALAGVGYLYYLLVYLGPMDELQRRVSGLESGLLRSSNALADLKREQRRGIEVAAAAQRQRLQELEQALAGALSEAAASAPPSPQQWKLAEVEYLLRIANHRLLMERDVDAAVGLLSAADDILRELDDFALHPVRAALADELLSLRSVRGNDVQGIYLRLEAVKERLIALPLELPGYFGTPPPVQEPAPEGLWETLSAELASYLQVRRFDGARKPLLAPEEAVYLELNLRLMLERAQLAALRRQQVVFEASLGTAREWLLEYVDQGEPVVTQAVSEIDGLLEVQLDEPLPDISASLSALVASHQDTP